MELTEAKKIAITLCEKLRPFCDALSVVGSIRRHKSQVKDIDIVAIPNEENLIKVGFLDTRTFVATLADPLSHAFRLNGLKIASFSFHGVSVDIYWATPETWGTLLLIRTGSKEHNIRLATIAHSQGMHLHAGGEGLSRDGVRIAGDTEESIFDALGVPFAEPEWRD